MIPSQTLQRLNKDFTFEETSLAASAFDFYDFVSGSDKVTQSDTDDYAPFRNLVLYNNGTTLLKAFLNQQQGSNYKFVPAGTILELNGQSLSQIRIENASGSTAGSYIFIVNNDIQDINALLAIAMKSGAL